MKPSTKRWWPAVLGIMLCCFLVLGTSGMAQASTPQIAAGSVHSVALKNDGTVWTWGSNGFGQLGDGSTNQHATPVLVTDISGVKAIAVGGYYSVAVKSDGSVWAWGDNRHGQLGDAAVSHSTIPLPVAGLPPVVTAISAGESHVVALGSDGTVWAWGNNSSGQLGNGSTTGSSSPVQVSALSGITAIAAGGAHTLAIDMNGTVWAWGDNDNGQLGNGSTTGSSTPVQVGSLAGITAIAAGHAHSLALQADGTIWSWGNNSYGQLGDGSLESRLTPVQVANITGIVAITAGETVSLAIDTNGSLRAWGNNYFGQLGDGSTIQRPLPVQLTAVTSVAAVAAGGSHSLAIRNDGTVWAWGNNYAGQLGDGATSSRTTPVPATPLMGVTALAAGYSHTVARSTDGSVWAWGNNASGQIGDGTTTRRHAPQQIAAIDAVTAVAAGDSFTLALKNDSTVWAWGDNWAGQLGNDTSTTSPTPGPVSDLADVAAIAAGGDHAVALSSDGTVWTWGNNNFGQLGDGSTTSSASPFLVYDLETVYLQTVTAIAAGDSFTLALKTDGTVWAWGNNNAGQLGDGTNNNSAFPVKVYGLSNITAIAAGGFHALALQSDGTVWAWGDNSYGQLGNGTTNGSNVPVPVPVISGVTALAAGFTHSAAMLQNGTLLAWGDNSSGQLGDGSFSQRPSAVPAGIVNAMAIAGGHYHTGAVMNDGTVWTWGWDGHGQLGDDYNTTLPRSALMQLPPEQSTFSASPALLNTGNAALGSTTVPQQITISNSSTTAVTVNSISLTGTNPSQFSVTVGSCGSLAPTLAPGASCTVTVTFTPFVLGPKSAILRIASDAATNPTLDVSLSGTGIIPYYTLTVTTQGPGSGRVDYATGGSCTGGCSQSYAQNAPEQLIPVADSGSLFSGWSGCDEVMGTICRMVMSGAKSVTAIFTPDQGSAIPVMALSPVSADFGVVATYATSSTQPFTISNSGDGDLFITRTTINGADSSQFSLQPGSCPSLTPTLTPGSSCTMQVTFVPTTVGAKSASLQATATDPTNPLQTASLTGLAYDPPPMGMVTINGSAGLTTTTAVTLSLSAFDNSGTVSQMRFSNTNTTWSSWEMYATSAAWTLTTLGGDCSKTVYVQFRDAAGNISGSFADSITLDTTPPTTTITAMPSPLSPARDGSFSFSATESATFQCRMDTGQWATCSSPFSFTGLADGNHTFTVKATDTAGNGEVTPPSYSFSIDTTAPETTINDQPTALSPVTSATFTFSSSDTTAIFHCKLDAGSWSRCYSPHAVSTLSDGSHTFSVKAIDWSGNTDLTPATAAWTVDTTPPDSTLTGSNSGTSATFTVSSSDPTATLQCKLDNGVWAPCSGTITLTSLANGIHTFSVTATDPAGNVDPTPASYSWTSSSMVQIFGGSSYATIDEAIAAAPDGAILQFRAMSFAAVTITSGKSLTFSGGYGENFAAPVPGAMTTLSSLTVASGVLTVENLAIQ